MKTVKNDQGSVLVFMTLMIVLLLIIVGMGLDTGNLAFIRSQGQPAVDSAALAAAGALGGTNNPDTVKAQAGVFNSKNDYLNSGNNTITASNATLINYDPSTGT